MRPHPPPRLNPKLDFLLREKLFKIHTVWIFMKINQNVSLFGHNVRTNISGFGLKLLI